MLFFLMLFKMLQKYIFIKKKWRMFELEILTYLLMHEQYSCVTMYSPRTLLHLIKKVLNLMYMIAPT